MATADVPLSLCFVDGRYQKFRSHKKLKKLVDKWDMRKLAPIILVPHPEEFRFAIVDGQGRYLAAPKVGLDRLPATILLDAPKDTEERLKFEAEYFIGQDTEAEKLREVEKHPSRLIIGDPAAVAIERVLNKYNIKIIVNAGKRSGNSILGSYTNTYAIAKNHGEESLEFIFSIIVNAGWDREDNGHYVVRILDCIWEFYPRQRERIHTFLSDHLRATSPSLFIARSRRDYPEREPRVACVLHLQDVICDWLHIKKQKIGFNGNKTYRLA